MWAFVITAEHFTDFNIITDRNGEKCEQSGDHWFSGDTLSHFIVIFGDDVYQYFTDLPLDCKWFILRITKGISGVVTL